MQAERGSRVTPLELFFDLVFVFAFTQVTTVLSSNPTWSGLWHGLLILSVAVPTLVALALVAAVCVALHAYEVIWWREARAEARAARVSAS